MKISLTGLSENKRGEIERRLRDRASPFVVPGQSIDFAYGRINEHANGVTVEIEGSPQLYTSKQRLITILLDELSYAKKD